MKICNDCDGTGFSDKIIRGLWQSGDCSTCLGRGWVAENAKREIAAVFKASKETPND